MTDNYILEHMTLTIDSINTEWWLMMIMDMIQYSEWVRNVRVLTNEGVKWIIEITDDDNEKWLISDLNLLGYLRKCWSIGDRTFAEPQNVDYDTIDGILQNLCFGELVYG